MIIITITQIRHKTANGTQIKQNLKGENKANRRSKMKLERE